MKKKQNKKKKESMTSDIVCTQAVSLVFTTESNASSAQACVSGHSGRLPRPCHPPATQLCRPFVVHNGVCLHPIVYRGCSVYILIGKNPSLCSHPLPIPITIPFPLVTPATPLRLRPPPQLVVAVPWRQWGNGAKALRVRPEAPVVPAAAA